MVFNCCSSHELYCLHHVSANGMSYLGSLDASGQIEAVFIVNILISVPEAFGADGCLSDGQEAGRDYMVIE